MAKAFYYLRPSKSNLNSICVGLRHKDGQFLISTGIRVNPKHWNSKKSEIKNVVLPELDINASISSRMGKNQDVISFVNNTLNDIANFINGRADLDREIIKAEVSHFLFEKNEIESFAYDLHSHCMEYLKINVSASKESFIKGVEQFLKSPKNQNDLFEYIDKLISNSEDGKRLNKSKMIAYKTVQRYRTTQKLLIEFKSFTGYNLTFNSIDKDFIDSFNSFMAKEKNYSIATMGKHIQTLKSFLNEATEDGVNTCLKFKGKAFATKKIVKDAIHLNESELNTMYNLDLSGNERLDKVRDLFLIGAWTGFRFSDFTDIKPENIKKDKNGYFFEKIQFKGKGKVIIPLNDTVLELLAKYGNKLPKAISNQKFNDYIKEVAELVPQLHEIHERNISKGGKELTEINPKYELVSSHTARRSMATNAYERGVPTLSIMAITGHKTEKAFLSYIKTSSKKHAEIFRKHDN